ncbi:MAG: hypothetical protein DME26_19205 [Verrucomicrobia bacterium]|nr:MAG: hypothetical protein DME26_19205 [Verrucomicrobiota bacterium]
MMIPDLVRGDVSASFARLQRFSLPKHRAERNLTALSAMPTAQRNPAFMLQHKVISTPLQPQAVCIQLEFTLALTPAPLSQGEGEGFPTKAAG